MCRSWNPSGGSTADHRSPPPPGTALPFRSQRSDSTRGVCQATQRCLLQAGHQPVALSRSRCGTARSECAHRGTRGGAAASHEHSRSDAKCRRPRAGRGHPEEARGASGGRGSAALRSSAERPSERPEPRRSGDVVRGEGTLKRSASGPEAVSAVPTPEAQRGATAAYALSFPLGASAATRADRRLDPSRFKGTRGYTPHPYPGRFHPYTGIGLDAVSPCFRGRGDITRIRVAKRCGTLYPGPRTPGFLVLMVADTPPVSGSDVPVTGCIGSRCEPRLDWDCSSPCCSTEAGAAAVLDHRQGPLRALDPIARSDAPESPLRGQGTGAGGELVSGPTRAGLSDKRCVGSGGFHS